ncbi:Multidrug resistance efflux pump [Pseudosulfitobacter pseudonitzschiae]|uniref:Curdlan synthesis protein n=1 Tax=Pseudosulfitobacter pseudonitzschiae TaxID=1402135 RepID=A0A073IWV9_9RHOB|nr:HlyD family efflux transporter periplasmic adaptor subunit [Pseudosulfitobacter pseudonitzschiae]KEJ93946.1 Curdlan synthesis protein [Pseudosulfitobacter pseudonitzschiae]QKS08565.1 HlyD family efflux transporter periplasmic adaptor subunit [Pseudosulfitobacter pseudonitzschiae]SHF78615.1 Multidrug resistance efflux pump [Pseudosulfitobacter pseudonitzschiae]
MKLLRLIISIFLIAVALWVIIAEQMAGASANAFVNAPVVTVRADTAGDLTLPNLPFGARVQKGETLASIDDPLVDNIRLNDLRMEQSFIEAEIARLEADLKSTEALRTSLLDRVETFRVARLKELSTRLEHARIRLAILEGGELPENTDQEILSLVGELPGRIPMEPGLVPLILDHARERVEVLQIALDTARAGVFLGDGYNDSPNAQQRATELKTVISQLQNGLAEAQRRLRAITTRSQRENLLVNAAGGREITSPVNGLYWEVLQSDGINVQRGDPILRLVNCDATFVSLSVTERVFNSLQIGEAASFRLTGREEVFEGTVARLAGAGAASIYQSLAVAPSQKHLERYDVALLVPELTADSERGCAIGRTGRAFFDERPLNWFRAMLD